MNCHCVVYLNAANAEAHLQAAGQRAMAEDIFIIIVTTYAKNGFLQLLQTTFFIDALKGSALTQPL